jgi:hypothetical protein
MTRFENYPAWIVIATNALSLAIYFTGSIIVVRLGLPWLLIYLAYILVLEFRLLGKSCVHCYYYGKRCAFGKGKLSSLFFKKGEELFCNKKITWKELIPEMLVPFTPIIIGIILLINQFEWMLLLYVIFLFMLTSTGNGFVRSSLACRYCKQQEMGCPAANFFIKKDN